MANETIYPSTSTSSFSDPSSKAVPLGKCGSVRASFNIILSAVGIGILGLPKMMARCGWILGSLFLIMGCFVIYTNSLFLCHAMLRQRRLPAIKSYEDVARAWFGSRGHKFVAATVHFTIAGSCTTLLIIMGRTMHGLVETVRYEWWVLISAIACSPLCFLKSLHEVSYLSAFGVATIVALCIAIIVGSATHVANHGVVTVSSSGVPLDTTAYWGPQESVFVLLTAFGNNIFAFNVANTLPSLLSDMKSPHKYPRTLLIALGFVFTVYATIAVVAYDAYGSALLTYDSVIDALTGKSSNQSIGLVISILTMMMAIPHYIVLFMPVANSASSFFNHHFFSASGREVLGTVLGRVVVLIATCGVAAGFKKFGIIVDFMGCLTFVLIAMVFPSTMYLATVIDDKQSQFPNEASRWRVCWRCFCEDKMKSFYALGCVCIGVLVCGVGLAGAGISATKDWNTE